MGKEPDAKGSKKRKEVERSRGKQRKREESRGKQREAERSEASGLISHKDPN